jgi:signal transduction histidine kinase
MRENDPGGQGPQLGVEIELDPESIERKRAERRYTLNVIEIPGYRAVAYLVLLAAIMVHNRLVMGAVDWPSIVRFSLLVAAYCVISWLALYLLYTRVRIVDLGDVFLVVDVFFWVLAIYYSGGDKSWLFFILLVRVADQAMTTVRRALFFSHVALLGFVLMIAYVAYIDQRPVEWPLQLAKALFLYSGAIYIALTTRPAERRRRRIAAAVRTARNLIVRLKEQSHELEEATHRAEQASQAKSMFLANISHEIRTPMTTIVGMTDMLDSTVLTAQQREYISALRTGSQALLAVINDILQYSQLDAGRIRLSRSGFDVRTLVGEVVATLTPRAQDKGLELTSSITGEPPTLLYGDPDRLRQVLHHLIGNAIKFTEEGRVSIRTGIDGEDASRVTARFEVSDTGIGFEAETLNQLFEPFVQADGSSTRRHGGTGLGLSIARVLAEIMGGEIGGEPNPDRGATFWFTVPLYTTPET